MGAETEKEGKGRRGGGGRLRKIKTRELNTRECEYNYFSGGVTKHTPQFLDSVALPASSRPPTHERQFRARFLMVRGYKSSMFYTPVIWGSESARSWGPKITSF